MVDPEHKQFVRRGDSKAGEASTGPPAELAESRGECGRYSAYRWALISAGVLNVLGAMFWSLPKDLGVALHRCAVLSVWFWAFTAFYVAIRRSPTLFERIVIGVLPLLIGLWVFIS